MRTVRVGLAQLEAPLGHIQGNLQSILEAYEQADAAGADLVVTPELALLGFGAGDIYFDKVQQNLEALEVIREASRKRRAWIAVGFVERDDHGFLYNAVALIGQGEIHGIHRKVQLVNYRLFDEKRYFRRGRRFEVFSTPFGRVGFLICEDAWFSEPARILAFRGADLLVVPSASPYDRGKPDIWEDFLRVRVLDNQLPVVFVNMAGIQDGVAYWGGSMAFSARGERVFQGPFLKPHLEVVTVDLEESRLLRRRDIRLREITSALVDDFVRAYREFSGEACD